MKKWWGIFLVCSGLLALAVAGVYFSRKAAPGAPEPVEDPIERQLAEMTLREKVGQLFCVRPEALDVELEPGVRGHRRKRIAVTERMRAVNALYPVGGIIFFERNILDEPQLASLMADLRTFKGAPIFYVDEEGGPVSRIAPNRNFGVTRYRPMGLACKDGAGAYEAGNTIGKYLHRLGFHVDLAPVADVNTNKRNPVIGTRAFSPDPEKAAEMAVQYAEGLYDAGILPCVKHFPGHGDTRTDSHLGIAVLDKTWEELQGCELIPFRRAIERDVPIVLAGHLNVPAVTGNDLPASLSSCMIEEKLRGELGYRNVVMTDGMAMGAITRRYSSGEAAVLAVRAGADIVLTPKNFIEAFDAVFAAVESGEISESRLDESVRRVLLLKNRALTAAGCCNADAPCP